MNLSYPSRDPLNDVIVDTATGTPVYKTESHDWVHRVTKLRKFVSDNGSGSQSEEVMAEIHWETLSLRSAVVIYKGQEILMKEYLRPEDRLNVRKSTRAFSASDANQYKWKFSYSTLRMKLYDCLGELIAESHDKHYGIFHKKQDYKIDILPPGVPIIDDIILSFIIMNHLEIERWESASATTAAVVAA